MTDASRAECEGMFARVKSGGLYTPPGRDLDVAVPRHDGRCDVVGRGGRSASRLSVREHQRGRRGRADGARQMRARYPTRQPTWRRLRAVLGQSAACPVRRRPGASSTRSIWRRARSRGRCRSATRRSSRRGASPGPARRTSAAAIATAGGLVFIGGTNDRRIRAFEARTGRLLWQAELPASGHATPISYRGPTSGRQFVVIAAGGGGRFSSEVSDAIVAFALR